MCDMMERRRFPRVEACLPLKLFSAAEADFITETINIGSGGAYCRTEKFIPVMTRLKILMLLPKEDKKSVKIECEGIVVRVDPEIPSQDVRDYMIAIYFSRMKKSDRAKIAEYVKKKVKSKPSWN